MAGTVFIVEQNTEGEGLNCPRLAGRTMSGGAREEEGRRSRFSNRFTGCSNGSWGGGARREGKERREQGERRERREESERGEGRGEEGQQGRKGKREEKEEGRRKIGEDKGEKEWEREREGGKEKEREDREGEKGRGQGRREGEEVGTGKQGRKEGEGKGTGKENGRGGYLNRYVSCDQESHSTCTKGTLLRVSSSTVLYCTFTHKTGAPHTAAVAGVCIPTGIPPAPGAGLIPGG